MSFQIKVTTLDLPSEKVAKLCFSHGQVTHLKAGEETIVNVDEKVVMNIDIVDEKGEDLPEITEESETGDEQKAETDSSVPETADEAAAEGVELQAKDSE